METILSDYYVTLFSKSGGKVTIAEWRLFENSSVLKSRLVNTVFVPRHVMVLKEDWIYLYYLKRFLETKKVDLTKIDDIIEMYKMASDYKIKNLLSYCRHSIKNNINPSNLRQIYNFAYQRKDKVIEYYCWIEFDHSCNRIFHNADFLTSETYFIELIVSRPKYQKLKEITIFEYLITWASTKFLYDESFAGRRSSSYNQAIRQYLNPFIKRIRFLSMNSGELEIVFSHNILSEEEKQSIISYRENSNLPATICKTVTKRIDHCYKSLIVYKNRKPPNDDETRFLKIKDAFLCLFVPEEDCFLYRIILPVFNYPFATPIVIKIEASGVLLHRVEYTTRTNNLHLCDPVFLNKNIECTVVGVFCFEKEENILQRLSKDAEYYIDDQEYNRQKRYLNKWYWRSFYIKIRLYF